MTIDDTVIRALVVLAVAAGAVFIGRIAVRWQRPTHPRVRLDGLGLPPGIVAFTSTQCENCKRVMSSLSKVDIPVREVTNELEPQLFAAAAVAAVPLVVVTDSDGTIVRQLAGTPSRWAIRRAIAKGGW